MRFFLETIIFSFVWGVVLRSFFDFGIEFPIFLIFIALILYVIPKFFKSRNYDKYVFGITSIVLMALAVGLIRTDMALNGGGRTLDEFIGESIEISGTISDEPLRRENYKRFVLEMNDGKKILIYDEPLRDIEYGDSVLVTGKLKVPENFVIDDGGETFDWVGYLEVRGINYEMFNPVNIEVSNDSSMSLWITFRKSLFSIKNRFIENIKSVMREPEASLVTGELLGERASLGEELESSLRRTGIAHVVVLSGYNVTIVADSIIKSLWFMPLSASSYVGVASIVLFALMTGASPTIVRASIMAILVILSRRYGRQYDIKRALMVAGFLMVFFEPHLLLFDLSFQLSFLATLGLIYISPKISGWFKFVPKQFNLREIVGATLGTQIFVLPLLIAQTGEISVVALPVNLLILPIIPLTMFMGFLTGAINFLSWNVSFVLGVAGSALASYQLRVVSIFDTLSFGSISIGNGLLAFIFTLYVFAFMWILYKYVKGHTLVDMKFPK